MGPLNAAVGLSHFPNLDAYVARRRAIFEQYRALLTDGFTFVAEREGVISNRWLTTVVLNKKADVEAVVRGMKEEGIECRHLWRPMHDQEVFGHYPVHRAKVSEGLFRNGLSLPSGNALKSDQVEDVAGRLSRMVTRCQL
jgi:dTDP-4-amino-4,6-dideoxygalactose transaminase